MTELEFIVKKLFDENNHTEVLIKKLRKYGRKFDLDSFVGGKPRFYKLLKEYQVKFNSLKNNRNEQQQLVYEITAVLSPNWEI